MSGGSDGAGGSGKSEAEIAFELVNKLKGQGVWGEKNLGPILDMFAECLDAAKGLRAYPGQNRLDAPVKRPGATAQTTSAPAPRATPQTAAQPNQAQIQAQQQRQAQAQRQAQMQQAQRQQPPAYKQG